VRSSAAASQIVRLPRRSSITFVWRSQALMLYRDTGNSTTISVPLTGVTLSVP
jgi:hypothetical protein